VTTRDAVVTMVAPPLPRRRELPRQVHREHTSLALLFDGPRSLTSVFGDGAAMASPSHGVTVREDQFVEQEKTVRSYRREGNAPRPLCPTRSRQRAFAQLVALLHSGCAPNRGQWPFRARCDMGVERARSWHEGCGGPSRCLNAPFANESRPRRLDRWATGLRPRRPEPLASRL
jgi:hypothetical protein